jgi:hypothetical protein
LLAFFGQIMTLRKYILVFVVLVLVNF